MAIANPEEMVERILAGETADDVIGEKGLVKPSIHHIPGKLTDAIDALQAAYQALGIAQNFNAKADQDRARQGHLGYGHPKTLSSVTSLKAKLEKILRTENARRR